MDELGVDRSLMFPTLASLIEERLRDDPVAIHVIIHSLNQWLDEVWGFNYQNRIFTTPVITLPIVEKVRGELDAAGVTSDDSISKVSVVGLGMKDHAGVASRMFQVLCDEGINIQMINTSEIKISVVVGEKYTELACRALHEAFELGTAPDKEEAH